MKTPPKQHDGNYRSFLADRYRLLKATKPNISARAFARKAGIASPSYFGLVIQGKRKLSVDYADKFALGLGLSREETEWLRLAVRFEHAKTPAERNALAATLARHRLRQTLEASITPNQVRLLADLKTLKLYLLAQCRSFQLDLRWIRCRFNRGLPPEEISQRIEHLLTSGLWRREGKGGKGVTTVAPRVRTGDELAEADLAMTHKNILEAAKRSVDDHTSSERVLGGRTFLFDPKRLPEVKERVEAFKRDLEAEFEDLSADRAYQLSVAFFELEKR
jgi:uncharacterized protein (TIGR02147 family)